VTLATLSRLHDDDLAMALRIRHLEQSLLDLFAAGDIAGTVHTCLGQEYIPVALAPLIAGDFVFSNHRGHGHYVAQFNDLDGILAEILGRQGALGNGVGGSQHLYRPEGFVSTGVQGESLPVAVGVALHLRRNEPGRIAVAYIGDGTWGEGVVYEALNLASLWGVPLLVVVEHNGIAQSTPTAHQLAGTIGDRVRAFGVEHHRLAGDDINEIRVMVAPVVARIREASRPAVLEFATVRLGPHSKGDDTRPADERARLAESDWLGRYARRYGEQFTAIDADQRAIVGAAVDAVRARPLTDWTPLDGN